MSPHKDDLPAYVGDDNFLCYGNLSGKKPETQTLCWGQTGSNNMFAHDTATQQLVSNITGVNQVFVQGTVYLRDHFFLTTYQLDW